MQLLTSTDLFIGPQACGISQYIAVIRQGLTIISDVLTYMLHIEVGIVGDTMADAVGTEDARSIMEEYTTDLA